MRFKVGDVVMLKSHLSANKRLGIAGEVMKVIRKDKDGLYIEPVSGVKFTFYVLPEQIERRVKSG